MSLANLRTYFCLRIFGIVALISLALIAPRGYPQTSASAGQRPTIVSNVEEVTLDLAVRDKKNKPVLDLKPDDIAVKDNGSPVKISNLRLVSGQSGTEHL